MFSLGRLLVSAATCKGDDVSDHMV